MSQQKPRYTIGLRYDEDSTEVEGQVGAWIRDLDDRETGNGSSLYLPTLAEVVQNLGCAAALYPDHDIDIPEPILERMRDFFEGRIEEL